jgi:hypothetical protein
MCLQSAVTAILPLCSGALSASSCFGRPLPKVCARVSLPHRCSTIISNPELARRSRAFLLPTGVLQELIRLGGKKKPRNPPASAQQPRPPVPNLSPGAQEVRLLLHSLAHKAANLLARVRECCCRDRLTFFQDYPSTAAKSPEPSSPSVARATARACTVRSCLCSHRRGSARPCP